MLQTINQNKTLNMILTLALMLVSAVLMIADIDALIQVVYFVLALTGTRRVDATLTGTVLMLVLGLAALIFIVVTFEYHLKHVGSAKSRKLLAITLGTQVAIFLLGLLV